MAFCNLPTSASQLFSRPSHWAVNSHAIPSTFVSTMPQYLHLREGGIIF